MIVASLLLILVAVALLVLGLTGGSSNLLISSIVASLLAAVTLVIGARQNAGARRAAEERAPEPAAPEFAAESAPAARSAENFAPLRETFAAESAESDLSDRRETVQLDAVHDADSDLYDAEDEAYEAGRRDAAAGMAAGASGARRDDGLFAADPDYASPDYAGPDFAGPDYASPDYTSPDYAGSDYDRAADAINAARSETPDENAWRRAEPTPAPASQAPASQARAPQAHASQAHAEPVAAAAGLAEGDFADADDEDPADEPLPQAVSPTDAVRVARLDTEVMVVDGRPRYHLPECRHLIGRLSEPIPVNEAVELGFSPCGLCRPVDRLVGAEARSR